MKIAIILGTVREGRHTHRVATYLQQAFSQHPSLQTSLLDLKAYNLPIYEDRWEKQENPSADLLRFGQELQSADAIILISPEYHGSYTGVLKNALDHYWKEFKRKPIGVVSTSTGKFGGLTGSIQMQHLILALGGYPISQKWIVSNVNKIFDENNHLIAADAQKAADTFLSEFLWFSQAILQAKQAEADQHEN
jgi:NAD(P)H-dependent FMN reductase